MILITGANGHYGKAAIEALIRKGVDKTQIIGLVRDERKATALHALGIETRIGDYNDLPSLIKAFQGVKKLLLVSGTDLANRTAQQKTVVHAAKTAGIEHILYTSVDRKTDNIGSPIDFILRSHIATEEAIKQSGITYSILRNSLYLDTLPWFLGEKVLDNGIYFPAGDGKVSFALRSEMAEAAATILTSQQDSSRAYTITGATAVSFGEIATMLTALTGNTVRYHSPAINDYVDMLATAGVPAEYIGAFAGFAKASADGEFDAPHADLENLLGRKPVTVEAFLKTVYTR